MNKVDSAYKSISEVAKLLNLVNPKCKNLTHGEILALVVGSWSIVLIGCIYL